VCRFEPVGGTLTVAVIFVGHEEGTFGGMYRGVDGRARVDTMGSQGCIDWFQLSVSNRASLRVSASLSVSS
jgi:hypothetical protein